MNASNYWANCFSCCVNFGKGGKLFFTKCGHLLCGNCVDKCTKPNCRICNKPTCGAILVGGQMPSSVRKYFANVPSDINNLTTAISFHINSYDKVLGRMDGLIKQHQMELVKSRQKLQESSSHMKELDGKIPEAQQMIQKLQNAVKTLTDNQETTARLNRSSVQRRLFPKSESLEAPRNLPLSPRNLPLSPRNLPLSPRMNLVPISHSSDGQALSRDHKPGLDGPAGDHNATKNTATTDPSLELELHGPAGDNNVTKNSVTTDPSLEAIMSKLANLDTRSLQMTSNATGAAQSKSTPMGSTLKPASNKRVLLQVIPKSVTQEVLHPFKSDFKKIHVSNNNSTLNNNRNMENDLDKSKATFNNNETGAMDKRPHVSTERGTFLAVPAAADEEFQKRILNKNRQDDTDTCICLRPLKLILCPVCGYTTTGRLRKTCQVHPKDLYLLDVDACPRCKETNKCVFVEYDLPEGFKQAINKTIS